jgi:cation-transporting ATPase E
VTIPAGTVAAGAVIAAYLIARHQPGVSTEEARTTAMLALLGVSLWLLVVLARPLTPLRWLLVAAMAGGCALIFAWPWAAQVLSLTPPSGSLLVWTLVVVGVGAVLIEVIWRVAGRQEGA